MRKDEPQKANAKHINQYKMAHMIGVAEWMRERAIEYYLNPDEMYTVGLLHDIGYLNGRIGHEQNGSAILSGIGLKPDIIFAIDHHGENPYKVQEKFGKSSISAAYVLLLEADMSIDAKGYRVGFDKRIEDIKNRYKNQYDEENLRDIIRFIKEYQKEKGISKPTHLFNKEMPDGDKKNFDYVCAEKGKPHDDFTIFANIISEDQNFVTIERYQKFGKFKLNNTTMSKDTFYEYYKKRAEKMEKYQSESSKGIKQKVEVDGISAEFVLITETKRDTAVPYFYIAETNCELLFAYSNKKCDLERAFFELLVDSDSELVTDEIRNYAQSVLSIEKELQILELNSNNEPFVYFFDGGKLLITPCSYNGQGTTEYYLTNDHLISSNDTLFKIASQITTYDAIKREYEKSKSKLQAFYNKNIKHLIKASFDAESLTSEQREALDTFTDWHKDVYGFRPHSTNMCEINDVKNKTNSYIERD